MKNHIENGPKIVVLGGGTGSFTLLSALKKLTSNITAVVNMADDGGSTGVLRDELGVLPPGDVRQCLVALSDSEKLRDLFNYRYESGTFAGHSFGNIVLSTLEKTSGSFADAVVTASEILRINGQVLPATLDNVRLRMSWPDDNFSIDGEHIIDVSHFHHDPRKGELSLIPNAKLNKSVIDAIQSADIIVLAPGDLYTSLGPLLVTEGLGEVLKNAQAEKVYVCNLVTKQGQTDGLSVAGHAAEIERFAGSRILNVVLYSDQTPSEALQAKYASEGSELVKFDDEVEGGQCRYIAGNFLGTDFASATNATTVNPLSIPRSLIRHDTDAIVDAIAKLCHE